MRTILCAVDFSEASRRAVQWAGALAARHHAALIVVHGIDPLLAHAARIRLGTTLLSHDEAAGLLGFADEALTTLAARPSQVAARLSVGEASSWILEAAARESADLIVMGTRGLGGVQKMMLGSTAERVVRRTRIPVLMVPDDGTPAPNDPLAALERIVAATDFGPTCSDALHWATAFARDLPAALVIAHVVNPVHVPSQWRRLVDDVDEHRLDEARRRLERIARGIADEVDDCAHVTTLGRPAEGIAALARQQKAGLIVMGLATTASAVARPGSVAYGVLRIAHVPVLVIPPESTSRQPGIEKHSTQAECVTPDSPRILHV